MKRIKTTVLALLCLATIGMTVSCDSSKLGTILSSIGSGGTIANVFTSVIGLDKVTAQGLVGTWRFNGPGCAFTSEDLLAKAGGEVAATKIEKELEPYYDKVGLSASNTYITFDDKGQYAATIRGKQFTGNYTFDEENAKITLKGFLFNVNCYAKREYGGIALLFEAKKLLTILQAYAAISGNDDLKQLGEFSKTYDGVRIGFDMKK